MNLIECTTLYGECAPSGLIGWWPAVAILLIGLLLIFSLWLFIKFGWITEVR